MHEAWNLAPQLSAVIAAALGLLALVLAASLIACAADRLARRGTGVPAARFYVGRIERSEPFVFIVDSEVRPLAYTGPGTRWFGWGSADHGGLQLAHSVLRDAGGADPAPEQARRFLADVIAELPDDGFVLAADSVRRWLRARRRAGAVT